MSSIFNKKNKIENTTYDDISSLSHTKWNCKYHIVFVPKYRRKIFYGQKRIAEYVKNQLQEDMMYDQITIKEYKDPFNG